MPHYTRQKILEEISNWSTDDVVKLLQKNKLPECCDAVVKRQVDGEGLLRLSEGSLNLWKSDLTSTIRWKLCRFVEELNNNPIQYYQEESRPASPSLGEVDGSSTSDWDTDFEDDEPSRIGSEDSAYKGSSTDDAEMYTNGDLRFPSRANQSISGNRTLQSGEDYDEGALIYGNEMQISVSNDSPVEANENQVSIVTKLQEQLRLRCNPTVFPKPKTLEQRAQIKEQKPEVMEEKTQMMSQRSRMTERGPKIIEQKPRVMEEKPTRMQLKPKPMEQKPKLMEQKPKLVEQKPNIMEQKSRIMEPKPQIMETKSRITEQNPSINIQKPKIMAPKPDNKEFARNKQTFMNSQNTSGKQDVLLARTQSPESNNLRPQRVLPPNGPPFPPKPKGFAQPAPMSEKKRKDLPKPPSFPVRIGTLNSMPDLPQYKIEDSDDCVYEPLQEQETVKRYPSMESMKSFHSTQSLSVSCARSMKGSNESIDRPRSIASVDDNQDVYESIPEKVSSEAVSTLHDSYQNKGKKIGVKKEKVDEPDEYVRPILSRHAATLPAFSQSRPHPTADSSKRPETDKFATCPRTTSVQPSDSGKATRPLPPTPTYPRPERSVEVSARNLEVASYTEKPWFHNVTRDEAIALIEEAPSQTRRDGYFLVRPSNAKVNQPWTLVLWYKNRTYNIAVRERPDSRYALGRDKPREQAFSSIEAIVNFYQNTEELVLNSANGDVLVGSTRLTETPPKRND